MAGGKKGVAEGSERDLLSLESSEAHYIHLHSGLRKRLSFQ
jgi:hypothetical protein